jgi:hypothetical protein
VSECAWFYARVIGGKAKLLNRSGFDALLKRMDGQEIDIGVRKHRKPRSLAQNGYLWFMYTWIAERVERHTKDSLHEAFGQLFRTDRSGPLPIVKSTTDMSTVEMTEYWEKIWQFCAETLDLVVPDPNSDEALQWSKLNG